VTIKEAPVARRSIPALIFRQSVVLLNPEFIVNSYKRVLWVLALVSTVTLECHSQVVAPTSLPTCLIQYSVHWVVWPLGSSRLMLYNSDQTYVEIDSYWTNAIYTGPLGSGTNATRGGKFTYTVDLVNPSHARIVYDGGGGSLGYDDLYFTAATSGSPFSPSEIYYDGASAAFTLYPRQATNGACNVSNLCRLAAGGTGTCGFVVQSGGPRWVLLRAIGASLGNFGVSPAVSSPSFTLYDSTQTVQGTSSVWSFDPNLVSGYQTVFSLVGAFPLSSRSDEGALLVPLNPGAYTAQFRAGSAGKMLFEAYILPF